MGYNPACREIVHSPLFENTCDPKAGRRVAVNIGPPARAWRPPLSDESQTGTCSKRPKNGFLCPKMSTNVLKVVTNVAEMVRLSQNDRENKRVLGSFGAKIKNLTSKPAL